VPVVALWCLRNPTVGSASLVVSLVAPANLYLVASEIDGVLEAAPFKAVNWSSGTGTMADTAVSTADGTLALDSLSIAASGVDSSSVVPHSPQTLLVTHGTGFAADDVVAGSSKEYPATGTTQMIWTWNASSPWAQIAVDLEPATPTASRVARLSVPHDPDATGVSWRMADRHGMLAFDLYTAGRRLSGRDSPRGYAGAITYTDTPTCKQTAT
jgi:hypothetical protein